MLRTQFVYRCGLTPPPPNPPFSFCLQRAKKKKTTPFIERCRGYIYKKRSLLRPFLKFLLVFINFFLATPTTQTNNQPTNQQPTTNNQQPTTNTNNQHQHQRAPVVKKFLLFCSVPYRAATTLSKNFPSFINHAPIPWVRLRVAIATRLLFFFSFLFRYFLFLFLKKRKKIVFLLLTVEEKKNT